MHACDNLETLCPRPTAAEAIAAYAARWPNAVSERVAVRAEPCELPEWSRFNAAHCFRVAA